MSDFAPYIYADGTSSQDIPFSPPKRIRKIDRCKNYVECKDEALERGGFCANCLIGGIDELYAYEEKHKQVSA